MKTLLITLAVFIILFGLSAFADLIYKSCKGIKKDEDTLLSYVTYFFGIGSVMLFGWLIMCIFG